MTLLGHVVCDKCVEVDPKKTKAVKNWPRLLTPTDIHSSLELASYYRRFVDGLSYIAASLTSLTKMKEKFEWTRLVRRVSSSQGYTHFSPSDYLG